MSTPPLHRASNVAALLIASAAMAITLAIIAACATGSAPASHPTTARPGAPSDSTRDEGQALAAPVLWPLRDAIRDAHLSELRDADWPEHRDAVERFYTHRRFIPAWIRNGRPTRPALEVIDLLERADTVGLTTEDYDAGRWTGRVHALQAGGAAEVDGARFDLALTVSALRYVSDLDHGRIDPRRLGFDLGPADSRATFDPATFVEELAATSKVEAFLAAVAPADPEYQRLLEALGRYRALAHAEEATPPAPFVANDVIRPGDTYADLPRLADLLARLGDLRSVEPVEGDVAPSEADPGTLYQGAIVEAVERFQRRHGLTPDGKIGKDTLNQLSTPLARRVRQIELALERMRWHPERLAAGNENLRGPAIVVNLPEFRLRALDPTGQTAFTTDVVVGKAGRTDTPVFTELMRTVVFRPSWDVPASITSREIVPEMEKDPTHLAREGYEIVGAEGSDASAVETLTDLRSGKLRLRQKPGPGNALGPVKFLFPNQWSVYLHGTPSTKGFARARRDLSHGCMRVADPIGLAEWVLRDQPDWDHERILEAVAGPRDEVAVKLDTPIPVHVVYHTVVAAEDGEVLFFDDLYGHDARLEQALEHRHARPGERTAELGAD